MRTATAATLTLTLFTCGLPSESSGDLSGVEELAGALSPLATTPTFLSGTLTIVLATGELAVVAKHPVSGAILVNDVPTAATASSVKAIAISGSSGANTVILDFANGTFSPGTVSAAGITVALAGGADVFKLRGTGAADTITLGGTALAGDIAFNVDSYRDVAVTGTGSVTWVFSLGGGNDVFNADTGAYGTGGTRFSGPTTVFGGPGDDVLTGGAGDDVFNGDLGDDTMSGGATGADNDTFNGGAGNDTVTYAERSGGVALIINGTAISGEAGELDTIALDVEVGVGGSGNDSLGGAVGDQTFYGGPGNDSFVQGVLNAGYSLNGMGNDTFHGGPGIDVVSYLLREEPITLTMSSNVANDGAAGEFDNIYDDIENVLCPDVAVGCNVTGNALDNVIYGGRGNDVLAGGAGDDTFIMGASSSTGGGADSVSGGAGIDTVSFATFGAALNVSMTGSSSVTLGKIINTDVENLTCPTASACVVTGNELANHLIGSSALDTITAAGGDDLIESSGSADVIDCGDGSDIVLGAGAVKTACEL